MPEYKHLKKFLKDRKHIIEEGLPVRSSYEYQKVPFSPQRIVGLLVHSMLSEMPRTHFYTDDSYIYYYNNKKIGSKPTHKQQEDIVKEDLILEIIDAAPYNPKTTYEATNGRARVSDFSSSFEGRPTYSPYFDYLKKNSKDISYDILRKEEKRNIRRAIQNEYEEITQLLEALKADEEPLPGCAKKLEKKLIRYGYKPPKSHLIHNY